MIGHDHDHDGVRQLVAFQIYFYFRFPCVCASHLMNLYRVAMVAFFVSRYNAFLRSVPCHHKLHDRWTLTSEVHQFHVVIFPLSVFEARRTLEPCTHAGLCIWGLRFLRYVLCTCTHYNIREVEMENARPLSVI